MRDIHAKYIINTFIYYLNLEFLLIITKKIYTNGCKKYPINANILL